MSRAQFGRRKFSVSQCERRVCPRPSRPTPDPFHASLSLIGSDGPTQRARSTASRGPDRTRSSCGRVGFPRRGATARVLRPISRVADPPGSRSLSALHSVDAFSGRLKGFLALRGGLRVSRRRTCCSHSVTRTRARPEVEGTTGPVESLLRWPSVRPAFRSPVAPLLVASCC